MECHNVLLETDGDLGKAAELLKQRSLFKAEKKSQRTVSQGIVEAYIHTRGRIGAMIEVNCETDFAANTDEFKELAHNLAMQVAAIPIPEEDTDGNADDEAMVSRLLAQPYIREPEINVQSLINETIAKVGENIKIGRFARFEVGE